MFVHLHVHSEYSLLDGACKIEELVQRVKTLGQNAVAITDHGNMYGVIDFYRACKKEGIKPIIGCEVYVAPKSRKEKDKRRRHLVLLCENNIGYQNLSYLLSQANIDGFYVKPRIDLDLLREHHEGLIALSACLAGEIPQLLMENRYDDAKRHALLMQDIMGVGNYYLELQDHGLPEQRNVNQSNIQNHNETNIPLVITNDAHYLTQEDAKAQDILLCIQTKKTVDDPSRLRFKSDQFYIKSEGEMAQLIPEYPEAIFNTQIIANRCNVEFEFGHYHLPEFQYPEGYDGDTLFRELCERGFQLRYPHPQDGYHNRLNYEMEMIHKLGFVDYFLIVADFVRYAKNADISVGPGRGSAAGSMVAYCMEITDVDPMKYNLYFERFLNPERVTMPDIDMDFCTRRREEVIDYVKRKYGNDHVAQIVTFGTMGAKEVVRDVGRVLNVPYQEVIQLTKLIPNTQHMTLKKALEESTQLKEWYNSKNWVKSLIDTANKLEGMPRHASKHAAGVVITRKPVFEYVPLSRNDNSIVTQFGMVTLEELGLLKMDFLGLRNLTAIDDTQKMIQQRNPHFNIKNIPDNDPKVFQMLRAGKTAGVFQMESDGMTDVCIKMQASCIEDLTAVIAMYRPGPMDSIPKFIESKLDPSKISYLHPKLEPILSVTYGCLVYQEQVMMIFQNLAGYSLGGADMVRRAISKKKAKQIEQERSAFIYGDINRGIAGCIANGIPEATAQAIYDDIYSFANYAFNKAHAVCYAIIAYQTAYLKCYYPAEYMAALLTSVSDKPDKAKEYAKVCREMGIQILGPDVNESKADFLVTNGSIRFGLAAIKNVGYDLTKDIIAEREKNGKFLGLYDFCRRMPEKGNRRVVDSLIASGAFDVFGYRSQLDSVVNKVLATVAQKRNMKRKMLVGQMSLFEDRKQYQVEPEPVLPNIPEYSWREKTKKEKDTIGIYLSGNPILDYRDKIKRWGASSISDIYCNCVDRRNVILAGIITQVHVLSTKYGERMAYFTIDDGTGTIQLVCFPKILTKYLQLVEEDNIVVIEGECSKRNNDIQVIIHSIYDLNGPVLNSDPEEDPDEFVETLYIRVKSSDDPNLENIKTQVLGFPGNDKCIILFRDTRKTIGCSCLAHPALIKGVCEVIGKDNVVVKQTKNK